MAELAGLWSILLIIGLTLVSLYLFFEVLGYTPANATSTGTAK
jgi:hypothetical protein